jgi:hypothetical protein
MSREAVAQKPGIHIPMSAAVEALSLTALTTLLATPPQYPRNPTHEAHERLVLYIVRVPGSKDVVLTPLKPPTKASISLDAIQSSLYYLHVESPNDEVVRQSLEVEGTESQENRPPLQPIQRKPLPPTSFANLPPSRRSPTPPKSYPHHQPPRTHGDAPHDEWAARGGHNRLATTDKAQLSRPLGARPMPNGQTSFDRSHNQSGSTIPDLPRLQIPAEDAQQPWTSRPISERTSSLDSLPPRLSPPSFTRVTVIRRDPTSGAQWNVGSIRVGARRHNMAPLQPVEVALTSPGYNRFAHTPDSASPVKRAPADLVASSPSAAEHAFRRYVRFRSMGDERRTTLQDLRSNTNELPDNARNAGSTKKARQIYCFTSPWQGTCIFSNGVDGRSLRLRHSLPASGNNPVDEGVHIAELRLNLPWSVLRGRDQNRQANPEPEQLPISQLIGKSKKDQFRRSMQHFRQDSKQLWRELRDGKQGDLGLSEAATTINGRDPPVRESTERSDDGSRLSLRLGREKAGVGFKGDSAKLGKLILEDEGLKMGDLTVACCMGVWWQYFQS